MKSLKCLVCSSILILIITAFSFPRAGYADPLDNWVAVTSPTNHWFYGLSYGNGMFVAVGDFGTVLTSTDGVAWITRTSGVTNHLYGVGFGNSIFVAVGTLGKILTSPDGATWTVRSNGQAHPVSHNLYGAAYGSGTFVVVGGHGTIRTSNDNGVTWIDPFWPYSSPTENWLYDLIYGNSTFVNVGAFGTILTSTDAAFWYPESSGTALHLSDVAYGNFTFVAVGENGTVLTSPNGISWDILWDEPEEGEKVTTAWLRGIAYDNGYFVAVGDQGTIITSPDGLNWTVRNSGTVYDLEDVAYDSTNNAFAAVGGFGIILLDGDTILAPPVRIAGTVPEYFSALQAAYDTANSGDIIQSQALHLNGNVILDRNISVTLQGGYDELYFNNPSDTTVNGVLTVTDGTVSIQNMVIR